MKTIKKQIGLLVLLSITLILTSCLDSTGNSHLGRREYSYITQTNGKKYALTVSGFLITSEKINLLEPGTVAYLTYQIDETTERINLDKYVDIYKVTLGEEPIIIPQEKLIVSGGAPEADPIYFENIITENQWISRFAGSYGDRWPIAYEYKSKKGEKVNVKFYKVPDDKKPDNISADILIDIRLEKTGSPEPNATEELRRDIIAADMSALRNMTSNPSDNETHNDKSYKDKIVKFRFYRADRKDQIHISDTPIIIRVAE